MNLSSDVAVQFLALSNTSSNECTAHTTTRVWSAGRTAERKHALSLYIFGGWSTEKRMHATKDCFARQKENEKQTHQQTRRSIKKTTPPQIKSKSH